MLFYLTRDGDCLAARHSQGAIEGTPKVFAPEALGIIGMGFLAASSKQS